ncbi:MAG TPA: hypothetical protein VMU15_04600 [Anaeromyxobacter sp.]|nr:hypothetical protein [Anaeromyxobacter sp.]
MPLPPGIRDGVPDPPPDATDPDEVPVQLDLLRADLYRLLDELARTGAEHYDGLVSEFERAWEEYKQATARGA